MYYSVLAQAREDPNAGRFESVRVELPAVGLKNELPAVALRVLLSGRRVIRGSRQVIELPAVALKGSPAQQSRTSPTLAFRHKRHRLHQAAPFEFRHAVAHHVLDRPRWVLRIDP